MFQLQYTAEFGSFGLRVKDGRKELWNKAAEAGYMSGVSLNGDLIGL